MPSAADDRPLGLPLTAGVLAFVGAVLTFIALFSEYQADTLQARQIPWLRWFFLIFLVAAIAAAVLLVARRQTQAIGAGMLAAMALTFVGFQALQFHLLTDDRAGRDIGAGFWLYLVAYLLVLVGAALAVAGLVTAGDHDFRRPQPSRARLNVAILGAAAGFLTAVGYGLNPVRLGVAGGGGGLGQNSPLFPAPRSLWAQLVVVLALVALPVVIAFVRRGPAIGLAAGLGAFVVAETFFRMLLAYGKVKGADSGLDAIEGTWVFLVGGLALAAVLAVRLVTVPDEPQRKAEPRESAGAA